MRSINRCLNKQLTELCQRSFELEDLSNKLTQLLPENLARECKVASFNKGCLILMTSDATWATQLRYHLPELRDKLRKDAGMYQLVSIKITLVSPEVHYKKPAPKNKHLLSEKAKATIISESQQCSYEPLQKALLRLADN